MAAKAFMAVNGDGDHSKRDRVTETRTFIQILADQRVEGVGFAMRHVGSNPDNAPLTVHLSVAKNDPLLPAYSVPHMPYLPCDVISRAMPVCVPEASHHLRSRVRSLAGAEVEMSRDLSCLPDSR